MNLPQNKSTIDKFQRIIIYTYYFYDFIRKRQNLHGNNYVSIDWLFSNVY